MRICLVSTVFPRWQGDGDGAFVWQQVRALTSYGHTVQVLSMHSPDLPTIEAWDGVPIVRLKYWWPAREERLRRKWGGLPSNVRGSKLAKIQLLGLGSAFSIGIARYARKADIVHANFTIAGAAACLSRPLHGKPVVMTVHGSDLFQAPGYPGGRTFTQRTLVASDQVVAVSSALRDIALELDAPASRIAVIPNSVDTEFFTPPAPENAPRDDVIVFVGWLIKRKGVETLLHAVAEVRKSQPSLRLIILGDGPEGPALRSLATQLGINESVTFQGAAARTEVRDILQRAKALVLPSTEEGQGVVLLEAMACGTPVIGSDVGGIPEVVAPGAGLLVPPRDVGRLAHALHEVTSNGAQWQEMSHVARKYVIGKYAPHEIARQYTAIYDGLVHKNGVASQ